MFGIAEVKPRLQFSTFKAKSPDSTPDMLFFVFLSVAY